MATSTALGVGLSFFGGFVVVYNESKNDFTGRVELDFGGIDFEFGRLSPLASTSVEHSFTPFLMTWSCGIDVFSSHQQSNVEKCETV